MIHARDRLRAKILRWARQMASVSGDDLARRLSWSKMKLYRLERGRCSAEEFYTVMEAILPAGPLRRKRIRRLLPGVVDLRHQIGKLLDGNATYSQIAAQLGCSKAQVAHAAKILGKTRGRGSPGRARAKQQSATRTSTP